MRSADTRCRPRRLAFVAAFPPCTDMAVSGARWFAEKRAADPMFQSKAVAVAEQCRTIGRLSGAPWFVENPVSILSSVWGKPDHTFTPAHFTHYEPADNYTKTTCLWTGGGFVMPPFTGTTRSARPTTASTRPPPDLTAPTSAARHRWDSPAQCSPPTPPARRPQHDRPRRHHPPPPARNPADRVQSPVLALHVPEQGDGDVARCRPTRHAAPMREGDSMSLIELPELIQGTEEWHDQRRGMVTASVVGRLVTPRTIKPASNDESRGLTAVLAAERITGYTDPNYVNSDMLRGIEDEPRARDLYSEKYAPATEVGFMVRDDWGFSIGFSPDGLVGDDGLIEVKSRRQKKQLQTILDDAVPIENMAQIQCGLLVSGRAWCDYLSYCGGMPMWVKRVLPDDRWFAAIVDAVEQFETTAAEMVAAYEKATKGLAPTERPLSLEMVF